jgi:hypothetical protein
MAKVWGREEKKRKGGKYVQNVRFYYENISFIKTPAPRLKYWSETSVVCIE